MAAFFSKSAMDAIMGANLDDFASIRVEPCTRCPTNPMEHALSASAPGLPKPLGGLGNSIPKQQQQLQQQQQQQSQYPVPAPPARSHGVDPSVSGLKLEGSNTADNTAVANAVSALEASMHMMRSINTPHELHEVRATPLASSNDGSTQQHRKSARTSMDQSAGRANNNKGLRHFSLRVCSNVESKGRTTYNEVADELVADMQAGADEGISNFDEKNVRRRVYDAINVLMAAGVMQKERKEIIWKGFPSASSNSFERLKREREQKIADVEAKQKRLQGQVEQHAAIKHLLQRNQELSRQHDLPDAKFTIPLPFIVLQVKAGSAVSFEMTKDEQNVEIDFHDAPFQIHDDKFILRNMMLASASAAVSATYRTSSSLQLPVQSTANSRQDSNAEHHQVQQIRGQGTSTLAPSISDALDRFRN